MSWSINADRKSTGDPVAEYDQRIHVSKDVVNTGTCSTMVPIPLRLQVLASLARCHWHSSTIGRLQSDSEPELPCASTVLAVTGQRPTRTACPDQTRHSSAQPSTPQRRPGGARPTPCRRQQSPGLTPRPALPGVSLYCQCPVASHAVL